MVRLFFPCFLQSSNKLAAVLAQAWSTITLKASWREDNFISELLFHHHSSTTLSNRGRDLISFWWVFTYTYRSPPHPHPVTEQWKEKQYTDELIFLLLCSLFLSVCSMFCFFFPLYRLCCLDCIVDCKRVTPSPIQVFTAFAFKKIRKNNSYI